MKKKHFILCILLDIAAAMLIPLNLFWLNCNIPEFVSVAVSFIVLTFTVFLFLKSKKGKTAKIIVGIFATLTVFVLLAGSYCNPYWNGILLRANVDFYSRSYDDQISAKEAIEDLEYAMKYLRKLYPDFHSRVPENISRQYENVKDRLEKCDGISVNELAREIESIFSILGDGHTFVRGNYSDRKVLKYYRKWADDGYEISAVDNISIEELLEQKSEYYSFEAASWQYEWLSDDIATMAGLDYLGFDIKNGIEYTLTSADEQTRVETCYLDDFVTWDEYLEFNNIDESTKDEKSFVSYEIDTEKSIAILYLDECTYNSEYINCVREMFEKVKAEKIESVAVDLRSNGGGNDQVVAEFFRYLDIDSYKIASMGWRLGFLYLNLGSGVSENSKYEDLLFNGNLYLLTSAGTFSSAMMFAEYVKDNKLGTIIGEAPGNNPNGCGEIVIFKLPNSELYMQISTKRFYRADKECTDKLVYPDIECDSELAMEKFMAESENMIKEDEAIIEDSPEEEKTDDTVKEDITLAADEQESEQLETDDVITAYITEDIEYSDEAVPVQYVDDLSLIEGLKDTNNTYAYQDGKIYFRKYHDDSYKEMSWGTNYSFIPGTQKEIVCIDLEGKETELFTDEGYGDIYLINDRFYMTDGEFHIESGSEYSQLYSVDMQGNDRIDYGDGRILAVDKERNIIILKMWEQDDAGYYVMNYETGEKKAMFFEYDGAHNTFEAYQDGWLYYSKVKMMDSVERLCAVSLEGEHRELIALTSDINKEESYPYREGILHVEVDRDRIYFIFGGYDGSASVFQGGTLISMKLDGTDYKAVETSGDFFYISHDDGKAFVYFPCHYRPFADYDEVYGTTVWDVDANICRSSELLQSILKSYDRQMYLTRCYHSANKGALCEQVLYDDEEEKTNIYAIPDDSGKVVRVAMDLGGYITKWDNEEAGRIEYENLYYADGYLYFTVKYSVRDEDDCVGWRDGYRRLRSEVYRLEIGKSAAQMLYSY